GRQCAAPAPFGRWLGEELDGGGLVGSFETIRRRGVVHCPGEVPLLLPNHFAREERHSSGPPSRPAASPRAFRLALPASTPASHRVGYNRCLPDARDHNVLRGGKSGFGPQWPPQQFVRTLCSCFVCRPSHFTSLSRRCKGGGSRDGQSSRADLVERRMLRSSAAARPEDVAIAVELPDGLAGAVQ